MASMGASKLGRYPADLVTTVVAQTVAAGNVWMALQGAWSTTVFATLTAVEGAIAGTWASVTLVAGAVIYGAFTNFTLTSGAVLAYRGAAKSG
jgi:hypothetical protein